MNKVLGIDLGTTNSVIAVIEGNLPLVIPNGENFRTTPSIVAFTKNGELLVGNKAKRQALINSENTFYSVKRFIGLSPKDIDPELKNVLYKLIEDGDTIKFECKRLQRLLTPEEISSYILQQLVKDAQNYLNIPLNKVVVTVPAYFNDNQRQATKNAGQIANLIVERILNEPTAASLAYGLDKYKNEKILVFDLGGGTFDVSILDVGDGVFEVLATCGDTKLGGDNFDEKISNFIQNKIYKDYSISLASNHQALQRIREASETAKIELSSLKETKITLPFLIPLSLTEVIHFEYLLTRDEFESICDDLFVRCVEPVNKCLIDANLNINDLDQVVLVGGSTRMPKIQTLVKNLTKKIPNQTVNPDEVVAIGAAIQGSILTGDIKDVVLLDVTPLSLGVETFGGISTKIINRNSTIPVKKTMTFSKVEDNQTEVEINILQGERELASDNRSLGKFTLKGISPGPRNSSKIEVTFDINVNGILSVSACDKVTNKIQSITIKDSSNLSESELNNIIVTAEKFKVSDVEKVKSINLKNECTLLIKDTTVILNNLNLTDQEKTLKNVNQLIEDISNFKNILEDLINSDKVDSMENIKNNLCSNLNELEIILNKKFTNLLDI
jgi:molecular chaperone DnaK